MQTVTWANRSCTMPRRPRVYILASTLMIVDRRAGAVHLIRESMRSLSVLLL
jgi:hypothetical protein